MTGDLSTDIVLGLVIILAGIAAAAMLFEKIFPDELTEDEIKKWWKK